MDHSILVARVESDKRPVPVVPVILILVPNTKGQGRVMSIEARPFSEEAAKDGVPSVAGE